MNSRTRRALGVALSVVLVGVGLLALQTATAPLAHAAPESWTCSDVGYLFQSPGGATPPHIVDAVDLVTGASTQIGTTTDEVNAVGYNVVDNFMYAFSTTTGHLVRIGSDLALTDLGTPAGTPAAYANLPYNVGGFDDAGNFWVMDNQNGRWLEISGTATSTPTTVRYGTATLPASLVLPGDWVFINGNLYAVADTTAGVGGHLVRFNTATGTFTDLGLLAVTTTATPSGNSTYGAAYTDGTYLYASRNQGGAIYRIDVNTPANSILLSLGPASQTNDGARCRDSTIPTVTLNKVIAGTRLLPEDQFTVDLLDTSGTSAFAPNDPGVTTTGTGTTFTSINQPVSRGATYVISDALAAGSLSPPSSYTGTVVCTVDGSPAAATPLSLAAWSLTIGTGDVFVCTVTNTPATPAPGLSLTKSVAPVDASLPFVAGQVLHYYVVVTNTGNLQINNILIDDSVFSGDGTAPSFTCPSGTPFSLDPGESVTCTADYTVVTGDETASTITNTATAEGQATNGDTPTASDTATVPSALDPAMTITKTAFPTVATLAGTAISYTYVVQNTGNTIISALSVDDSTFSGTGPAPQAQCDFSAAPIPGGLVPGEFVTCTSTAPYLVTQADMDAGVLTNTARALGDDPDGQPVLDPVTHQPPSATASVTMFQAPALTLVKVGGPRNAQHVVGAAGDTITYTFTVTNTGNVTVSSIGIAEEDFSGSGGPLNATCPSTPLAPGDVATCQATYSVTTTDMGTVAILNRARATGSDPGHASVVSPPDRAVVGVVPGPTPPPGTTSPGPSPTAPPTGGPRPPLAATGGPRLVLVGLGLALVAAGAVPLLLARRRRV